MVMGVVVATGPVAPLNVPAMTFTVEGLDALQDVALVDAGAGAVEEEGGKDGDDESSPAPPSSRTMGNSSGK